MGNTFWHQRELQPKRKFRWVATIGDGKILYSYVVKKVTKPEWTTANKEHKILGHTFNFPGPVTWNTVDINFIDLAGTENEVDKGNAALFLQNAIHAAGYQFPTSINNATMGITKARATAALGKVKVSQLDAGGKILETYLFHNPFIEKVNFGGDFDYDTDDFVDVTLTLRYDWAKIIKGSSSHPFDNEVKNRLKSQTLSGGKIGTEKTRPIQREAGIGTK